MPREDPIGFRVQRPNHSTIAAGAIKLSALCSTSSFHCELLDAWLFSKDGSLQYKKVLLHAEIEPAREDPIGFRVQRLNHPAIAAGAIKLSALCSTSSFQCELLDAWLPFQSWMFFFNTERSSCLQDSNLRGKSPLDFESNAVTTRPSQVVQLS